MLLKKSLLLITILSICLTGHKPALYPANDFIVLEDFEKYNSYPFAEWKHKKQFKDSYLIYSLVKENNNKFLRGSSLIINTSTQLVKEINYNKITGKSLINWDIYKYPCLSWQWRVHLIPENANESIPELNDSAAGIYVIFQKRIVPFAGWQYQSANWIKYVWSSSLPVGTIITRDYSKAGIDIYDGKYVVVASGKKNLGEWITFKRNVLEDYIKFFGEKPKYNPILIGILTDANNTKSKVQADYDNIRAYAR